MVEAESPEEEVGVKGTKGKTSEKRKQQNRMAQRAFRARKEEVS